MKYSAVETMAVTPALSSAPRRVVPSVVMMSCPSYGPEPFVIIGLMFEPDASGDVSMCAMNPMAGKLLSCELLGKEA